MSHTHLATVDFPVAGGPSSSRCPMGCCSTDAALTTAHTNSSVNTTSPACTSLPFSSPFSTPNSSNSSKTFLPISSSTSPVLLPAARFPAPPLLSPPFSAAPAPEETPGFTWPAPVPPAASGTSPRHEHREYRFCCHPQKQLRRPLPLLLPHQPVIPDPHPLMQPRQDKPCRPAALPMTTYSSSSACICTCCSTEPPTRAQSRIATSTTSAHTPLTTLTTHSTLVTPLNRPFLRPLASRSPRTPLNRFLPMHQSESDASSPP
ncbi:unnamed protein product, partial [Closterium sp. NIES-53]